MAFNIEKDKLRVKSLYEFDQSQLCSSETSNNSGLILGLDEVGRGPVAGPVCVGGVIMKKPIYIKYLNDSKKVTEKRRIEVCNSILSNSLFCHTEFVQSWVIDRIGIVAALQLGFNNCIEKCLESKIFPDLILVDGNRILLNHNCEFIVKGDSKSASIAAASCIAKVKRDQFMECVDSEFPQFMFKKNKGYGTAQHLKAVSMYGICKYHRKSFLNKYI